MGPSASAVEVDVGSMRGSVLDSGVGDTAVSGVAVAVAVAVASTELVGVLVGVLVASARAVAVALYVAVTSGVGDGVGVLYDQLSVLWHFEHWPRGWPLGRS